ncbi:LysR substrate-binding domain-containing protein [uncultured Massilia sp.]|uniref:LysR substrate-binding domain-containing protein n=1 Tax=uncultured Massilia sp. TaxID=169973 RepID=UPI0025DE1FEA|nr:LysR substrate-binding domain-containing protein [uncultured Massilia sp.]
MISSRLLAQFIAVAEELHFGRAALRLHMSQPPLSQAIQRLEEHIGVALFDRANRTIALTDAGRVFLKEARRLEDQQAQAVAHTRQAAAGLMGTIVLGFVGSVSYGLLPELLTQFRKHHADVAFDLREATSVEQIEDLKARRIDLGIVRLPLGGANDLEMRVIKRERMIAVLPRAHPLAALPAIPLASLAGETFMMFPADRVFSLHAKTLMACQAAGFSPRLGMSAWQMPTMVSLIAAGVGIALLPSQIVNIAHPGVIYRELEDRMEHLELEIALAWRRDDRSRLREAFVDAATAYFGAGT